MCVVVGAALGVLGVTAPAQARPLSDEDARSQGAPEADGKPVPAGDAAASSAPTEEPAEQDASRSAPTWFLECALSGRLNPDGMLLWSRLGYRWPLFDGPAFLLRDTRLDVAADVSVTPVYVSGGVVAEVTPLSVVRLRASVQRLFYFGTFGRISEFGSLDADWSPARLSQLAEADAGRATAGSRLELGAVLQAAVGPLVAFIDNGYAWVLMDVAEPYYDPYFDLLLDSADAVWSISAVVGVVPIEGLTLGGRWERLAAHHSEARRQTVGVVAVWNLPASWIAWGAPRITVLGGLYVEDRYRLYEPFVGLELSLRF
jgi:hypothetical protein